MSRRNSRTNHDEDYVDVPLVSEEENDPELEKVLAKIQKLNDLEEAGTNPKKRKKAEPPPPQPAPPPQALPQAPPLKAARKSRGGKAVLDPLPGQAWHPAEAALLLILITGQVPVVKLPSEGRITNQYKSVFYYYFSISLSLRVLSEAFADLVGEPITPQRIKSKLETVEMKGKLSRAKVLPIPSAKPVPQQNFPLYDNRMIIDCLLAICSRVCLSQSQRNRHWRTNLKTRFKLVRTACLCCSFGLQSPAEMFFCLLLAIFCNFASF